MMAVKWAAVICAVLITGGAALFAGKAEAAQSKECRALMSELQALFATSTERLEAWIFAKQLHGTEGGYCLSLEGHTVVLLEAYQVQLDWAEEHEQQILAHCRGDPLQQIGKVLEHVRSAPRMVNTECPMRGSNGAD